MKATPVKVQLAVSANPPPSLIWLVIVFIRYHGF
ncbi:Uncharacterized protein dnm_094985 [Desulfonema magnum]|uniref:Uncharacterized protein n=1 Tax=Desulfonema magnum TaxID=45655 RepID=A0A975BX89_9BACT|nr:Uncharacterized protein dnm_094985 [Desulfonema magnum]